MANPKASLRSVAFTTIVGILVWLTVLAIFGIRFPVIGFKWSEVPPLEERPNGRPQEVARAEEPLESLEFATIALNTPHEMNLNETAVVELLVGLTMPSHELAERFEGAGVREFARIRVSERMEARLTGANFAVVATTPEEQTIPDTDVAGWKWEVKPTSQGSHSLHLTLSSLGQTNSLPLQSVLRAYDKRMQVNVTGHRALWSYIEPPRNPDADWIPCTEGRECPLPLPWEASLTQPDS